VSQQVPQQRHARGVTIQDVDEESNHPGASANSGRVWMNHALVDQRENSLDSSLKNGQAAVCCVTSGKRQNSSIN